MQKIKILWKRKRKSKWKSNEKKEEKKERIAKNNLILPLSWHGIHTHTPILFSSAFFYQNCLKQMWIFSNKKKYIFSSSFPFCYSHNFHFIYFNLFSFFYFLLLHIFCLICFFSLSLSIKISFVNSSFFPDSGFYAVCVCIWMISSRNT